MIYITTLMPYLNCSVGIDRRVGGAFGLPDYHLYISYTRAPYSVYILNLYLLTTETFLKMARIVGSVTQLLNSSTDT